MQLHLEVVTRDAYTTYISWHLLRGTLPAGVNADGVDSHGRHFVLGRVVEEVLPIRSFSAGLD